MIIPDARGAAYKMAQYLSDFLLVNLSYSYTIIRKLIVPQQRKSIMHILITNDDGLFAPGIFALQKALRELPGVRISILAPQENHSAIGHKKSLRNPLRVRKYVLPDGSEGYGCSGSPTDAVVLALKGFLDDPIDLVVSGINQGANMGEDLTYSGTVSAAMEAVLQGVPALAVSLDSHIEPAFDQAALFVRNMIPCLKLDHLPEKTLLNINIPLGLPKGVKITRQGQRIYYDRVLEREDPSGRPYYWIGGDVPGGDDTQIGTDIWAVANGFISITPIQLDMTNNAFLPELASWRIECG